MRKFIVSMLLSGICLGGALAQQPSANPPDSVAVHKLRVLEKKVANSPELGFRGNLKCDGSGNIYFQAFEGGLYKPGVINKFSREGVVTKLNVEDIPDLKKPEGIEFAISPTGDLYVLLFEREPKKAPKLVAAVFDRDLHLKNKITFDEGYSPRHLAIFPSGEVLIDGRYYRRSTDGSETYGPYTALFDSSGRKLKDITFEADLRLKRAAAEFQKEKPKEAFGAGGEWRSIDLGFAITGEDGLVYVMRRAAPAIFYTVNAAGEIVNRFDVEPPAAGLMPLRFQLSQNQLAIEYHDPEGGKSDRFIKIVNAKSGEDVSMVDLAGTRGAMACFTEPARFSFLTGEKSKMAVTIAEPE